MPEDIEVILATLEEEWTGQSLVAAVERIRTSADLLRQLDETTFFRRILVPGEHECGVDMHILDSFYQGTLSGPLKWRVFCNVCRNDNYWDRLKQIHRLHQAASKRETPLEDDSEDAPEEVHEETVPYGDAHTMIILQPQAGHLVLSQGSAAYRYDIVSRPAARLSGGEQRFTLADEAVIESGDVRCSIAVNCSAGRLTMIFRNLPIDEGRFRAAEIFLETEAGEKIEPDERNISGDAALVEFEHLDLERPYELHADPALMAGSGS